MRVLVVVCHTTFKIEGGFKLKCSWPSGRDVERGEGGGGEWVRWVPA